jgi:hypothetical protein
MKDFIIRFLGGYTKDEVLTTAVAHLYNTIGSDDILTQVSGRDGITRIYEGEKELNQGEISLLKSEARIFLKTSLWKVLQNDIKYKANKRMFEECKTEADMIVGKSWLYVLDCQETCLKNLVK